MVKKFLQLKFTNICRGGSSISCGGRGPVFGGVYIRRGCFSVKMGVKMKELGLVGGGACAGKFCM